MKQPIFGRAMYLDTDVTEGQLVKITSAESVSLCESGTAHGMALLPGKAGEKITVELFCKGIVALTAGASVTAGDELSPTTGGKAIKLSTGTGFGVALTTATTGKEVVVMVR